MPKTRYHYNIMLRPEPEGGFTAIVPALPGCVSYGRTLPEARKMAKDAISGYIKSLRKHKEPVPTDDETRSPPWTWSIRTKESASWVL
jgi:antitoxin HicB